MSRSPASTPAPVVVRTRAELAAARAALEPATVALVPTLGALHAGHRALLDRAAELAERVVVSIFVNPLQFGPAEDFNRYPRTLDADLAMCAEAGAALVFVPSVEQMYADTGGIAVTVEPGELGRMLEGASRPGHFAGVLTVVAKLFHLFRPDVAVFGQKDAQQLVLIRRMVADLDFPVRIEELTTVREPDGLALSSRNRYLSTAERRTALALSRALWAGSAQTEQAAVLAAAAEVLAEAATADPPLQLDYLALVDPNDLSELAPDYVGEAFLAIAAKVGTTRLIDNARIKIGPGP
ncbi:MAG: pantoate--beta-alanine ligase [Sporichthyaceae bacterium]|nr:pantoate--beta-alanine ligase [Sporichthyaceae bacterium]